MFRKALRRISRFLVAFVLIWAAAAALDAVAEPRARLSETASPLVAATLPSRGLFGGGGAPGGDGGGESRDMIACGAAVLTLVVLISMGNRGRGDGEVHSPDAPGERH